MNMLKVEFHAHTNYLQPNEGKMSPKELIDTMKSMGYDALTITEHYDRKQKWDVYRKNPLRTYEDFKDYAKEKGILLIPGVEVQFDEGEVLLINFRDDIKKYKTLEDLKKLPKSTMIAAPHPYFILEKKCIGCVLDQYKDLFDAIEHSYFYTKHINFNKKAIEFAKKNKIPLIGTSDVHRKVQLNRNYTLVDSEKNIESIIKAVRQNKIEMVTKPLSMYMFTKIGAQTFACGFGKLFRNLFN